MLPNSRANALRFTTRIALVAIFWNFSCAVDRSAFKTCNEASFCKRHRTPSAPHPPYRALPETIDVVDSSFNIVLENTLHKRRLSLKVSSYGDGRIGAIIDEVDPLRPRFRATDSFVRTPVKRGFRETFMDGASTTLVTLDHHKILIYFEPFRLDILDNDDVVMTVNSQSLLKVEHFQNKPTKSEEKHEEGLLYRLFWRPLKALRNRIFIQSSKETSSDPNKKDDAVKSESDPIEAPIPTPEETADATKPAEEEGIWDEHYKSHFDSKPFGASSVGVDISLVGFKYVYGIPEHADSFVLKSTTHTEPYRLYNLDVFEYELNNPMSLYGAIPYIMGHSEERSVGLLWLNPSETWIDIKSSVADKGLFRGFLDKFKSNPEVPQVETHWISEAGLIEVYFFMGPSSKDVFRQFTDFFGTTPLPPLFSIGYHQCRWNYNDMEDVQTVSEKFDDYDLPMDTMWLDIEYTDGKKYFTWDSRKFNDPKKMIENLEARSRKLVVIIDPHIKKDNDYAVYKEANDLGYFVRDRDERVFEGWCWPGASMYLDFLNPVVRDWWADKYSLDYFNGTTDSVHIWNDMNEPSVFNGPEVTMHKDCKHYGGWEHREVHNMYGFYNHMATYKGLLKRTGGKKRPFILTRSFFLGSQRYASVWTGDNMADWSHLKIAFPMLLSLGVAGIPFVGADVGGFFKNPGEELLVRWYQAGAFNPFFRAHAHIDTKRREPWLFSESSLNIIRQALKIRYKMLSYWYTLFYEHVITGLPILRPLWLEFPKDSVTFTEEYSALVGSAILVRPVVDEGASSVSVYLPGEKSVWYDFDTLIGQLGPGALTVSTPMEKIPVFIRGGSILPFKMRPRRSSLSMRNDPLTLYVALDFFGKFANGTHYFDDGETLDYQSGLYCYRRYEYNGNEVSGILSASLISGRNCQTDVSVEKIVIMGLKFNPVKVEIDSPRNSPLNFDHKVEARVLTIRKPAVGVGADWTIRISAL